jgi:hypothetical protein
VDWHEGLVGENTNKGGRGKKMVRSRTVIGRRVPACGLARRVIQSPITARPSWYTQTSSSDKIFPFESQRITIFVQCFL